MELHVTPRPRWPVEHRNVRALHGMVTALIGEQHHPTLPGFALLPWPRGIGWGMWIRDEQIALRLAGRSHMARLFDRDTLVHCSPLHRARAPVVTKRGRRRLRIDAVTPVCVRSMAGKTIHTFPTGGNLTSTLASWLPPRIGVPIEQDSVRLELVEASTFPQTVQLGGKFGAIRGWVGSVVVETNAVGEWLLRACETFGLGGRTAFGFGRVRVSAC